jgi:hypothetical protein
VDPFYTATKPRSRGASWSIFAPALIRTDEGTEQARTNDRTLLNNALASGAQMISTDYPLSEPSQWSDFVVGLPGGEVARCNPVSKPPGCDDKLLERNGGLK